MAKLTLILLIAVCFHQAVCKNNTRQARSADFFNNLTAPIHKFFNFNQENESTILTPVGEVPAYPLWKIHKYNGVQLKPINLGAIPYLEVPVSSAQPPKKKFQLPSLEQLQLTLGTNSHAETIDAIREMASTRDGLKLIVSYIKANIGDTDVDVASMKKEDIDSMLSQYQVLSKETAKPIVYQPTTPIPIIQTEENTESIISRIHSFIASKFSFGAVEPQKPVIPANYPPSYNLGPRGVHPIHGFNPFVHVVPQRIVQHVPVFIVPQIVYKEATTTTTPAPEVSDDSDSSQISDSDIKPMAHVETAAVGDALAQWELPSEEIKTNFTVHHEYGPPQPEYGPPTPPSTIYGVHSLPEMNQDSESFNRFEKVMEPIIVADGDDVDIRTNLQSSPLPSQNFENTFFKQSASIMVGPKIERTLTNSVIPFPVLPELPPLPEAENFAQFQPPSNTESPGSFRFLPLTENTPSPIFDNRISNLPNQKSVFSFASEPNEAQPDRRVLTTKFEQPGFSYTQLRSLPLETGIQFRNVPGQISSFGDKISSHIFEEDPLAAASETNAVVIKDVPTATQSTTSAPIIQKHQRQRWIPKSRRKHGSAKTTASTIENLSEKSNNPNSIKEN